MQGLLRLSSTSHKANLVSMCAFLVVFRSVLLRISSDDTHLGDLHQLADDVVLNSVPLFRRQNLPSRFDCICENLDNTSPRRSQHLVRGQATAEALQKRIETSMLANPTCMPKILVSTRCPCSMIASARVHVSGNSCSCTRTVFACARYTAPNAKKFVSSRSAGPKHFAATQRRRITTPRQTKRRNTSPMTLRASLSCETAILPSDSPADGAGRRQQRRPGPEARLRMAARGQASAP